MVSHRLRNRRSVLGEFKLVLVIIGENLLLDDIFVDSRSCHFDWDLEIFIQIFLNDFVINVAVIQTFSWDLCRFVITIN